MVLCAVLMGATVTKVANNSGGCEKELDASWRSSVWLLCNRVSDLEDCDW